MVESLKYLTNSQRCYSIVQSFANANSCFHISLLYLNQWQNSHTGLSQNVQVSWALGLLTKVFNAQIISVYKINWHHHVSTFRFIDIRRAFVSLFSRNINRQDDRLNFQTN